MYLIRMVLNINFIYRCRYETFDGSTTDDFVFFNQSE
ncbi:hypothetical protein AZ021_003761 [Enterobacter ludwigii]|nr:hypothetical protein AZ021_003761 [Enterobacter ludwigii]